MARYNLTLRDGSTIQVEAPENASQEEILRRANRQRTLQGMQERFAGREEGRQARLAELDAMRPPPPEEETGFFGDLAGGFASGVVGVGETAALGAATLLDEEEELAARERIQGAASAIRPSFGDQEDLTYKSGRLSVPSQGLSVQVLPSLMVQARRVLVPQAQASQVF
jgi:hypothetical protein